MKEAQIQTLFRKYLEANTENENAVYELKICNLQKNKSFAIDKIKEHQIVGLLKARTEGIFIKIPDMPHFAGSKFRFDMKKPFDCLFIKSDAYIGICFYLPRRYKNLYLIKIDDYLDFIKDLNRKSFGEKELLRIPHKLVSL